jgi:hypothetical protein
MLSIQHENVWGMEIKLHTFITLAVDGSEWSAPISYMAWIWTVKTE